MQPHKLTHSFIIIILVWHDIHTYIHTYIFINPRSHVTIQDAKKVSDEIEKGAKKKEAQCRQQYYN